jgi:hypothetical protein
MLDHFRELGARTVRTFVDEETMEGIAQFFTALDFETGSLRSFVKQL